MREGRRGMVLAVNYEMVSDATRTLESLRRIEELTPDHELTFAQHDELHALRQQLTEFTMLPAIPAWRITGRSTEPGHASSEEIDQRYNEFLGAALPSSPDNLDRGMAPLSEANDAMEALQEAQGGSPDELMAALRRATAAFEALRPEQSRILRNQGSRQLLMRAIFTRSLSAASLEP